MTRTQANELAAKLKGLLPTMTDEQVVFWRNQFQLEPDPLLIGAAIERYVLTHAELKSDQLTESIREQKRRDHEQQAAAWRQQQQERRDAIGEWAKMKTLLDGFTDGELDELKVAALNNAMLPDGTPLNDVARAMLAKFNPRTSKTVMALIYKFVTVRQTVTI